MPIRDLLFKFKNNKRINATSRSDQEPGILKYSQSGIPGKREICNPVKYLLRFTCNHFS